MRLGPLDKVGNDKEITGKLHVPDHLDLEFEALFIFLGGALGRVAVIREAHPEALTRLTRQFFAFGGNSLIVAYAICGGEFGQNGIVGARAIAATLCNLDSVFQCLGEIGKQRDHFLACLEMMLVGKPAALGLRDDRTRCDGQQGIMGIVVVLLGEIGFVGGNQRQIEPIGKIDQARLNGVFQRTVVTLDLDIQLVAEHTMQYRQPRLGLGIEARCEIGVDCPLRAPGQTQKAQRVIDQPIDMDGRMAARALLISPRDKFGEVGKPAGIGGDQDDRAFAEIDPVGWLVRIGAEVDGQFTPDDRLNALARGLFGKLQRAEEIVGVGNTDGGLSVRFGHVQNCAERQCSLKQGECRMDVEMDETGTGHCELPEDTGLSLCHSALCDATSRAAYAQAGIRRGRASYRDKPVSRHQRP